jgi:biopolymer transport protein ExbD
MKIRNTGRDDGEVKLEMTPMIDIVFQLLVFFIMTFKIVSQEGDFNIKMPQAAPRAGSPDESFTPPLKVKLEASANGTIANIVVADVSSDTSYGTDFEKLRNHAVGYIGDERGPGSIQADAEVELDVDFRLKYGDTVKAITMLSGFRDPTSGELVKLFEKIKFKPQPEDAGG